MPNKVTGGTGPVPPKPPKQNSRAEPSPEEQARRQEDKVLRVRVNYDR